MESDPRFEGRRRRGRSALVLSLFFFGKGEQKRDDEREYCCVVKIDGIRQWINDLNYNAFCDSKLSNFREDNLIAVIALRSP
jgi:hypothetical protein